MYPDVIDAGRKFGGRAIAVCTHPSDNNILMVASESGGLFKTTNRGINWTQVSGSGTFWFSDVKYFPTDPSIVIATAYKDTRKISGGGVWLSTNNGDLWKHIDLSTCPCGQLDDFSGYSIAVDPGSNRIWAGTSCGLVYSDDKGTNWNWLSGPKHQTYNFIQAVESIIAPSAGHIKIVTREGIRSSNDNGVTWSYPDRPSWTGGNPGESISEIHSGLHNQIASSPFNENHLFYACKYNDRLGTEYGGLFFSSDNGDTWINLRQNVPEYRFAFVKVVPSLDGIPNSVDVYYSNGGRFVFDRATYFIEGETVRLAKPWQTLNTDLAHVDVSDMCFETNGKTPLLMTSDGGVAIAVNSGLSWKLVGGGSNGFCALQINDLTGQVYGKENDMYFPTQDNFSWASNDNGASWPFVFRGEGSSIRVPEVKLPGQGNTIIINTALTGRYLTKALFEDGDLFPPFPNCSVSAEDPSALGAGIFIQNSRADDHISTQVNFNKFFAIPTSATWSARTIFPEPSLDLHKKSGDKTNPVFYQAIGTGGNPAPYEARPVGIKRIENFLGYGSAVPSDVTGFGSLGSFKRTIVDEYIFGVNPGDPNHLIVPDISTGKVKVTLDGGQIWNNDDALTKLVTQNGEFDFSYNSGSSFTFIAGKGNSQITEIAFDPKVIGRIVVGTMQAGFFISCDNGATWGKAEYSEQIPAITGFYFIKDTVFISSYGRGLWRYTLPKPCFPLLTWTPERKLPNFPVIYWRGVHYPVSQIQYTDSCSQCGFYLVDKGNITGYTVNPGNGQLTDLAINSGTITGYGFHNNKVELPFKLKYSEAPFNAKNDSTLMKVLASKEVRIKGLFLEKNIIKGLILSDKDISSEQLPKAKGSKPVIAVDWASFQSEGNGINKLIVYGKGFAPAIPVSISIDGNKPVSEEKVSFTKDGIFSQVCTYPLSVGEHTIMIEQIVKGKTIRNISTFFVPMKEREFKK